MFSRRISVPRNAVRAGLGWFAAAWYLAVTMGVPIPTALAGGKDLSRPFLCMHRQCGCMNAEQCYRSCCCHTAAERLAFARKQGELPPAELLAAAAQETLGARAPERNCCQKTSPVKNASSKYEDHGYATVNLHESLACQGAGQYWLMGGAALPLKIIDEAPAVACTLTDFPASFSADSPLYTPLAPPPKRG